MECVTRGIMERVHGLGVMGNPRIGINSTVLDSQLHVNHQRGIGFVQAATSTNTQ